MELELGCSPGRLGARGLAMTLGFGTVYNGLIKYVFQSKGMRVVNCEVVLGCVEFGHSLSALWSWKLPTRLT